MSRGSQRSKQIRYVTLFVTLNLFQGLNRCTGSGDPETILKRVQHKVRDDRNTLFSDDHLYRFHTHYYANLICMINMLITMLVVLSLLVPACGYSEQQGVGPGSVEIKEIFVLEDNSYLDSLLDKINKSQSGILISMYIFKTSGKKTSAANKVKDALIKAAKRGIKVIVILEEEGGKSSQLNKENRITGDKLEKGGAKVYFDSPRRRTHVKAIVIDDRYTFIGSHNLTASALQYNKELSLMIDSVEIAKKTARYIVEMIDRNRH